MAASSSPVSSMTGCVTQLAAVEGLSLCGMGHWGPRCGRGAEGQARVPSPSLAPQSRAHREDAAGQQDADSSTVGGNCDGFHFFLKIGTKHFETSLHNENNSSLWLEC